MDVGGFIHSYNWKPRRRFGFRIGWAQGPAVMSSECSLSCIFQLSFNSAKEQKKKSSPGRSWSTFSPLSNPDRGRGKRWLLFFPVAIYKLGGGGILFGQAWVSYPWQWQAWKDKVPWLTIWPGSNEVRVGSTQKEILGRQNTHKKGFLKNNASNSLYTTSFVMSPGSSFHQRMKNLGRSLVA